MSVIETPKFLSDPLYENTQAEIDAVLALIDGLDDEVLLKKMLGFLPYESGLNARVCEKHDRVMTPYKSNGASVRCTVCEAERRKARKLAAQE